MGIVKLAELIRREAPGAVSHKRIGDYAGKAVAMDTSITLCQFRAALPRLRNRDGAYLSSVMGLFYRTLHFLERGLKPVFVFEGRPPAQKRGALERRAEAEGRILGTERASSQTEDCQRLLRLLGVPYLQAPGEGEALCAQLAKGGLVHAVASEDMDTLAFGGSLLVRQLNASKSGEVVEYSLPKVLEILGLTQEQFVDLCILLGCDFCEKIRGLGPRKALDLIRKHKTIENVVLHINREVHPIPLCWKYQEARSLFLEAAGGYGGGQALSWTEPDEEGLVTFLCRERHMKWGGEGAEAAGEVSRRPAGTRDGAGGGGGRAGGPADVADPVLQGDPPATGSRRRGSGGQL
ncbi:probable flap endonuclease 1 homolog isoform X2 [Lepisosteus oculatus]|uniref:probable flap endonuclease 1 homolog isoform X2 n=1 Tax=Lepisosteus oculatus TaxID=7918 RepID=UPI0035F52545